MGWVGPEVNVGGWTEIQIDQVVELWVGTRGQPVSLALCPASHGRKPRGGTPKASTAVVIHDTAVAIDGAMYRGVRRIQVPRDEW